MEKELDAISDERLLELKDEDLVVKEYDTYQFYGEAILKCGLYAIWSGSDDNYYGRIPYSFFARVSSIIVREKSVHDEYLGCENDFIFSKEYRKYYEDVMKLDRSCPKYKQPEKIALSITEIFTDSIMFAELFRRYEGKKPAIIYLC